MIDHEWVKFPVSGLTRCRNCRILKSVWNLRVSRGDSGTACEGSYQDGYKQDGRTREQAE